jgi:DNA-binding response OmpR family regulator
MNQNPISSGYILIVDDEKAMRNSLADILKLEGYKVQSVSSGEAAVEALRREAFDLMLLDLKMPGMDGLEVLDYAAREAPDTQIILLTAHGSLESAIEALRKDAHDYLLKPSSPAQILESVAKAFKLRKEQDYKRNLLNLLDTSLKELKEAENRAGSSISKQTLISLDDRVFYIHDRRELWQAPEHDNCEEKAVSLTPTEGKLLRVLLENRGKVFTHRELVARVQGYSVADWEAPEVLRPLVSRLRQKLSLFSGGEHWIRNVRGTGYVFDTAANSAENTQLSSR